jgi:hypothetical protein
MIKRTIYRFADKGVRYLLEPGASNNKNTVNMKRNLKNAYVIYMEHTPRNFNKGKRVGAILTNSIFKIYEKQANKRKFNNNTPFTRGLKTGVRERVLYWVPGVYVRSVKRKIEYDASKFMKRARSIKGVENIRRLFSTNNNKNANRGNVVR